MSTIVSMIPATPWTAQLAERSKAQFDAAILRYDAWFLVLLAGMAIWCVVYQGKNFTGAWQYKDWGLNVSFECR